MELNSFEYDAGATIYAVRTVMLEGEPWFVAKDVCDVLGLSDVSMSMNALDDDELTQVKLVSGNQLRKMWCINEPGLYSLILRSRKPEAKQFKRWVTHEVLPSIRKHGAYMTAPTLEKVVSDPDFMIGLLQNLKMEQELRLEAERTKAYISDKKTATAMATASAKSRQCNKLTKEVEELKQRVGEVEGSLKVSQMHWLKNYFKQSMMKTKTGFWVKLGQTLARVTFEMGLEPTKVYDAQFGQVNSYPAEVVDTFKRMLVYDPELLQKYRK